MHERHGNTVEHRIRNCAAWSNRPRRIRGRDVHFIERRAFVDGLKPSGSRSARVTGCDWVGAVNYHLHRGRLGVVDRSGFSRTADGSGSSSQGRSRSRHRPKCFLELTGAHLTHGKIFEDVEPYYAGIVAVLLVVGYYDFFY